MGELERNLREACRRLGAELEPYRDVQNGRQFYAVRRSERVLVNLYSGAKGESAHIPAGQGLLGSELQEWLDERRTPESPWAVWIGSDESGKGDYFGPLVVAGVLLERAEAAEAVRWGVRDSKELPESKILDLDRRIRETWPSEVVTVTAAMYNALYERERNVNAILGDAHARVIGRLCGRGRSRPEAAVVDRFGSEEHLLKRLSGAAKELKIVQRPHAESDPAVAAASVVARAAFVRGLRGLSRVYPFDFPFGAGEEALEAARAFAREFGREKLPKVAKVHFKTTLRV